MATRMNVYIRVLPPAPANLSSMTKIQVATVILKFAFPHPPILDKGNEVRALAGMVVGKVVTFYAAIATMPVQR